MKSNRREYMRLYMRIRRTKIKLERLKRQNFERKIRRVVASIDAVLVKHPERSNKFGAVLCHILKELK